MEYQSFTQRVEQAIASSDFHSVVQFLVQNPNSCKAEPTYIQRLLNHLGKFNMTDQINDCFQALIKIGFAFDSIEYVSPLRSIVSKNNTTTQIKVLNQLIQNQVSIDTSLIQKALEMCFNQLNDKVGNEAELEESIVKVAKTVLVDPSKYLTFDFVSFLLKRLIESGKNNEAERMLLDPRISVTLYSDLWNVYFEIQIKKLEITHCLTLIDKLQTKIIGDFCEQIYNSFLQQFVLLKGRTQITVFCQILDHLLAKKIPLTYLNQVETLIQVYHKERDQSDLFTDYLQAIDYTLDPNVFNFIINLILELGDFKTGIKLFEMIIDSCFKKVDLSTVDVSKQHLKCLLKLQTLKLREGDAFLFKDLEQSLIMSSAGTPKKNKLKQIHEQWFPDILLSSMINQSSEQKSASDFELI